MMKKLVAITGASSGIGKALAERFSAMGHPVLMMARRVEKMEALHLEHSMCKAVDVTDYKAVAAAIAEAEAEYGPVDLLVNCAGVMLLGTPDKQAFEEWERMIDVNVKGVLTGTHIVLPKMIERKGGTIINISSTAGRKTYENHSVYCGSKFAVHAVTDAFRQEASPHNVRVLVVAPGVVETELLSHTSDSVIKTDYEAWKQEIHGGLEPEQIADCVQFAYQMPQSVSIREIVVTKTLQKD